MPERPSATGSAPLTLCCLLWAHPGRRADLIAYEDEVLAMLIDHHGEVLARGVTAVGGGLEFDAPDPPDEVQVLRIADRDALADFLADPRRAALADQRDRAIARTQLFAVDLRG